jgi:5S rRNA maturation endonuclease (ribonuclease M5)
VCGLELEAGAGPSASPPPSERMRTGNDQGATLEEFVTLWHRLRLESARPGTTVLVEGERDRRSVRRLGLPGAVAALHSGRTLAETAQALVRHCRRVVVLTDWDTEGGHLAHRLAEFLEAESVVLDLDTRRRLARVLRGEVVHVEGLYGWARRLAEAEGDSIERRLDEAADGEPSTG